MVETPELTSMTRSRTVRPLVAAWVLVLVILGTGVTWLSLSAEPGPPATETVTDNELAASPAPETPRTQTDHDTAQAAGANESDAPLSISQPPQDQINLPGGEAIANADHVTRLIPTAGTTPASLPAATNRAPLVKAPIDGLIMAGANGPLPVLGPDSLIAWKAYARPQDMSDNRPKIAVIVTGIGLNSKTTDLAITTLPGEIDLGFSPYGRKLQDWMDKARAYGHESFLMIPTEPLHYPENDPGPHTLLAGAPRRDNLKKLDWVLSQVTGYVGVINEMGSKFTASEEDILPILEDLNSRGLMVLDSRSTRFSVAAKLARQIAMPRALNNLYIDNKISSADITKNLTQLENTARSYGVAVGVARAIPLSIRELEIWARGLEDRGLQLVPITAIANRQPVR